MSSLIRVVRITLLSMIQAGHLPQNEIHALLLESSGKGRKLFLYLLILSCLQLKIILMPKWHILGYHILISFRDKGKFTLQTDSENMEGFN
jgi:hypothetical protein